MFLAFDDLNEVTLFFTIFIHLKATNNDTIITQPFDGIH